MYKATWEDRVRKLIKILGSDLALAIRIGVSFNTIQRWKRGASAPSPLARTKVVELENELKEVKK